MTRFFILITLFFLISSCSDFNPGFESDSDLESNIEELELEIDSLNDDIDVMYEDLDSRDRSIAGLNEIIENKSHQCDKIIKMYR